MEKKMNDDLDFRVGDVVCDCGRGTGRVCEINSTSMWVLFYDNSIRYIYALNGKSCATHPHRLLYHGTWEQVFGNLPDIKPKRKVKRWVNLYPALGYDVFESRNSYTSAAHASSHADPDAVAVAVEIEVDENEE